MNSKSLLTFISAMLLSLSIFASTNDGKYTLSGKLRDKSTKEELVGAVVTILELNKSVATDENGYYSLLLPAGEYTVNITFIGYKTFQQKITLTGTKSLDFDVEDESAEMEEVIISEKRQDENINQMKMSTNTLEIKDLKTLPALFGEVDVLRSIQSLPGVQTAGEGTTGFYVRGGSADQNLILLDEAPIYNASHLLGFFSVFNADVLKSADIYKGGIPAEYGGRLSSIVDVKTKNGSTKEYHGTVSIGLLSSKLTVEGPIKKGKGSFILSGRRTYADLFLKLNPDFRDNKLYFYDLNFKGFYHLNEKNKLSLSGYYGKDVFAFGNLFGLKWGNAAATLRWDHSFNKSFYTHTSLIFSDFSYNIFFSSGDQGLDWKSDTKEFTLKHGYTKVLTNNEVKFGVFASYRKFNPGTITPTGSSGVYKELNLNKYQAAEYGAFLSNEQKLSARLSAQYGLRLTGFTQLGATPVYNYSTNPPSAGNQTDTVNYGAGKPITTYWGLEPRLSLRYIINPTLSIKASYNHMYQYLHLVSNATAPLPTNTWLPSSTYLKPQVSDQVAAGLFKNFRENMFECSIEVYYKWMDRVTDFKDNAEIYANNSIETEVRQGRGWSYGTELFIKKNHGRLTGWISYTLSKSERKVEDVNGGNVYRADYDRRHNLNVISNFKLTDRWTLGGAFVYSTGRPVTLPVATAQTGYIIFPYYTERNGYAMPSFNRLDLSATYTKKHKKYKNIEFSHNITIYNVYSRKNPFTVYAEDAKDDNGNIKQNEKRIVMLWLFPIIPSYSFTVTF